MCNSPHQSWKSFGVTETTFLNGIHYLHEAFLNGIVFFLQPEFARKKPL